MQGKASKYAELLEIWFSPAGESLTYSPLRNVYEVYLQMQMLSQGRKGESEHCDMRTIFLGNRAAIKALCGNLEQGSAVGHRTEIKLVMSTDEE